MRMLLCALLVLPLLLAGGCNKDSDSAKGDKKNEKKEPPAGRTPQAEPEAAANNKDANASPVAIKDGKAALSGENSHVHFTGTKKDGKHDGGFSTFTGTLELNDKGDALKALSLEIDVNSLFSDEKSGKLTGHLKSKDFFDAAKFPKVTFASTKIEAGKEGLDVSGKLTLRGETKEISFPIKAKIAKNTLTGESSFQFSRKDFGMTYRPDMVDDTVTIRVKVGVAGK